MTDPSRPEGAPSGAPLAGFLELRASLGRTRVGTGGRDTCHALSAALDEAIGLTLSDELAAEVAVLAVGGYGRREQSLYSDIDVMILHTGGAVDEAVKAVLYPLWDANLKVGHSVRTVPECIAAAKENFESLTALLSARLVAGDPALLGQLIDALAEHLKGRPLTSRLTGLERARRRAEPYPQMAANLKSGRGGLRTLQSFWWERRRSELLGAPPAHSLSTDEATAWESLLAVRNALHATAGRAMDSFVPELREVAANWLSNDLWDVAEQVTEALRTVDGLAVARWPDLMAERPGESMAARLRSRLRKRSPQARVESRPLARAVAAARRPGGVILGSADRQVIRKAGSEEWTANDTSDLLDLLDQGERGRIAFEWLASLGWVEANLPELAHTIAAPQLAPFHEHPVDTHLWRTADEMRSLIDGEDSWFSDIATDVADRELLLLAAFVHDIGKALPGDHSKVGAEMAHQLCFRIRLDDKAEPIRRLVLHHLLLADTATKRDTADPKVVAELAAVCGDMQFLQALYLLTVADARATGRTMWNDWKGTLLRNLFVRTAAALEPVATGRTADERIASLADTVQADPAELAAHVRRMPRDYLESHTNDELAAHHRLASDLTATASGIEFLDPEAAAPRLVVVTQDAPGLIGAIAGALTINNLEVLDARLHTRSDGVACATFHVRKSLPDVAMPSVDALATTLAAARTGELDLADAVVRKTAAYQPRDAMRLVVRAPSDPTLRYTAIEVRCEDRPGVLFIIVEELYAAGLHVVEARIDTRGEEVRDLFYVTRDGAAIRDVNEIQPLIAGLRSALRRRLLAPR